mmetsp:Transcript_71831/g.208126  ORF Transcript_71831/g.208126 Transcript_71831/m.208126 type:complete len:165 (-) Transcript_71831:62-556(-)
MGNYAAGACCTRLPPPPAPITIPTGPGQTPVKRGRDKVAEGRGIFEAFLLRKEAEMGILAVIDQEKDQLIIEAIAPESVAAKWNESNIADLRLSVGDKIVMVNDKQGAQAMLREIQEASVGAFSRLLIVPGGSGAEVGLPACGDVCSCKRLCGNASEFCGRPMS